MGGCGVGVHLPSAMPCWWPALGGGPGGGGLPLGEGSGRLRAAHGGAAPTTGSTSALKDMASRERLERQLAFEGGRRQVVDWSARAGGEQHRRLSLRLGPSPLVMLRFSGTEPLAAGCIARPKPRSGWRGAVLAQQFARAVGAGS